MSGFDDAFALVIGVEGGYVNDIHDPGGPTKFGLSKRAYPDLDIETITLDRAKAIYKADYWDRAGCEPLPWPLSLFVFDCSVNQGVGAARDLLRETHDPARFMAARAQRYVTTRNFDRFGDGWFWRLFKIALEV